MLNLLIILILPLSLLLSCTSSPQPEEIYASYKTERFHVYYRENDFSLQEVERIGRKKERILDRINREFEVNYDGCITAYLYLYGIRYAYSNTQEEIFESRPYALSDDGHEIAHIVTVEELGYSPNSFLKEGIAVALELKMDDYNVIEEFVEYHNKYHHYIDTGSIKEQILNDTFDYSYYSYLNAGAFVKYLMITVGVSEVKEFYIKSINYSSSALSKDFENIFCEDLATVEKEFIRIYFPDTIVINTL